MRYKGYALVFTEVEADNEEQAREKIANKLSDDYFSWFDPDEIVLDDGKGLNDITQVINRVTEILKDAFKGSPAEELLKQMRTESIIQTEHDSNQIDVFTQQIEELQQRVRELEDKMYLIESRSDLLMDSEERYYNSLGEDE